MTDGIPHLLVTGGAGFIGSHFVHHVLAHRPQTRVTTLDALTYAGRRDHLENLPDPDRHELVVGDVRDDALVRRLLEEREIRAVVHFAAQTHVDRSIRSPRDFLAHNVEGTFALLEVLRSEAESGVSRRLVQISTDEVFGHLGADDAPFTETTPYAPRSPYSASKAAADHFVRAYHETYGLDTVVVHSSNNYGPRQHDEKFIPTIIRGALRGEAIPIYGDGSQRRDWLFVRDNCEAILRATERGTPGESFVIGAGEERSNLEVARSICSHLDRVRPQGSPHDRWIEHVTDRPGHDWRYAVSPARAHERLGWAPATSFEQGLVLTIEAHGAEGSDAGGTRAS